MTKKQPMRHRVDGTELGLLVAAMIGSAMCEIGLFFGWW